MPLIIYLTAANKFLPIICSGAWNIWFCFSLHMPSPLWWCHWHGSGQPKPCCFRREKTGRTQKRKEMTQVTFTWAKLLNFPIYNLSMSPFKTALWVGVLQSHFTKNSPSEMLLYSSVWDQFSCTVFPHFPSEPISTFPDPQSFLMTQVIQKTISAIWSQINVHCLCQRVLQSPWCLQCVLMSGRAVGLANPGFLPFSAQLNARVSNRSWQQQSYAKIKSGQGKEKYH